MPPPGRAYKDAINCLNTLQSNAAVIEAIRKSGGRLNQFAMPEMVEYVKRLGYQPSDLNKLNVVHITGTKGKGSTSAFCDSLLRSLSSASSTPLKVGLYTSPHLVAVRERIRINGEPLSEDEFAKYFFEVWDRLDKNREIANEATPPFPVYFRYLTLLAFHTFISLKVDATILEVGVGGAYDSTNVVPKPKATGIASLGLDHTAMLGNTISEVAWNKAGIFKEGVPAFTVGQVEEGMGMLRKRAEELKSSSFTPLANHPALPSIKLGLAGVHQRTNATLSLSLIHALINSSPITSPLNSLKPFISADDSQTVTDAEKRGLETTKWPARCQTVVDSDRKGVTWYLDGAHTKESLEGCAAWFFPLFDIDGAKTKRKVLVFNCTNGRSAEPLLEAFKASAKLVGVQDLGSFFKDVIFCSNVTYSDGHSKGDLTSSLSIPSDVTLQTSIASSWSTLFPSFPEDNIHVKASIQDAISVIDAREGEQGTDVLVCGSLILVGGVIEVAGIAEEALKVENSRGRRRGDV